MVDPAPESPHEDLLDDLDRMHIIATSATGVLPEARLRRLLQREARELHTALMAHFQAEEEGRYMGAVLDRVPSLDQTVDRLHAQHAEIDTRLGKLVDDCLDGPLEALRDRASAILDLVGEHERDEIELVERAR